MLDVFGRRTSTSFLDDTINRCGGDFGGGRHFFYVRFFFGVSVVVVVVAAVVDVVAWSTRMNANATIKR